MEQPMEHYRVATAPPPPEPGPPKEHMVRIYSPVYERLTALKIPNESYTQVVAKLLNLADTIRAMIDRIQADPAYRDWKMRQDRAAISDEYSAPPPAVPRLPEEEREP